MPEGGFTEDLGGVVVIGLKAPVDELFIESWPVSALPAGIIEPGCFDTITGAGVLLTGLYDAVLLLGSAET
jgi:hypothetical protein